jgi:hypothetical protein
MSLSSIIYAEKNIFLLPHGYRSPDFPLAEDYVSVKNKLINTKLIRCDPKSGIHGEILSNFTTINDNPYDHSYVGSRQLKSWKKINDNIFWIKWDNVRPRKKIDCALPWQEQIKRGNLPIYGFDDETNDESPSKLDKKLNKTIKFKNEDYRCFVTNAPIYEDCYIIDIYKQQIIESVPVDELDEALLNGAKIYTEPVEENKNTRRRRGQNIRSTKVLPKKKNIVDRKFVKIIRMIYPKEPVHILISPYAAHYLDAIKQFELTTMSKVIIYRTFCPRTCKDVIDSLEQDELYKKTLHAFNKGFEATCVTYKSVMSDVSYQLFENMTTLDFLYANDGVIKGKTILMY